MKQGPGIHQIGGWTGAMAGLDLSEERNKSLAPAENKAQCLPICTLFAISNDLFRLLLPSFLDLLFIVLNKYSVCV